MTYTRPAWPVTNSQGYLLG